MTIQIRSIGALFLAMVILSACSPSPTPTPAIDTGFPAGIFVNGEWSWEFKPDGTFITSGPIGSETGTFSQAGSQVVITCQCCGAAEGTYAWKFEDQVLSFSVIDDECTNRKGVVDSSTWTKKP